MLGSGQRSKVSQCARVLGPKAGERKRLGCFNPGLDHEMCRLDLRRAALEKVKGHPGFRMGFVLSLTVRPHRGHWLAKVIM